MEGAYESTKNQYRGYYMWELIYEMGKLSWMRGYSYSDVMKEILKFLKDGHGKGSRYSIEFLDSSLGTVYPKMKKIYFIPKNV